MELPTWAIWVTVGLLALSAFLLEKILEALHAIHRQLVLMNEDAGVIDRAAQSERD